ncbi:MAG: DUF1002 domain-containing protein, partial [Erysipelotrichaceae bacterium]|nr:DUF1002 domain-containing protein [Erysipelotrichaceae bacterium]
TIIDTYKKKEMYVLNISKKLLISGLSLLMCMSMMAPASIVYADDTETTEDEVVVSESDKPYLSLGADLSSSQLTTVLGLLGVDEDKLDEYNVSYVTNAEEHEYLDSYLSSSTIGSHALSSVVVIAADEGDGVSVTTKNITYCTAEMYENAMVTAGISDASAIVAGPMNISGTAALIGVIKAYSAMQGEEVDEENVDAAVNEIVVTGEIAEDNDDAEALVAYLKEQVAQEDMSESEINDAIDVAEEKFNISLTDEQQDALVELLAKISDLDLDIDSLKSQAQEIYDKLGIDIDTNSLFSSITSFFGGIWDALVDFFSGFFSSDSNDEVTAEDEEVQSDETDSTETIEDTESTSEETTESEETVEEDSIETQDETSDVEETEETETTESSEEESSVDESANE